VETLSLTLQTAYAELLDQLVTADAHRTMGHLAGTFVTKKVRGHSYVYFQYSAPGGTTKQVYVGPGERSLDKLVTQYEEERAAIAADRERIEELCAILRTGAIVTDAGSARVLRALADAGVFKLGGVLVGTHAFAVLGNLLGVRWTGANARTEDIDIAASANLEVAVPDLQADVPAALESLGVGFLPVLGLSPKSPSTSFAVRGRALRVDLITPAKSRKEGAVRIPRLNAAAAPLSFVELLLEDSQPAAVIDGAGILVRVPHPARFAVHKLIVATRRVAAFQTKQQKDITQAALLIEALEELRPGELRRAWKNAAARGKAWARALRDGTGLLRARHAAAYALVARYT
jgi:hypothetical protein